MENEGIHENRFHLNETKKRNKHFLFWVVFGFPMIYFLVDFLFLRPPKWDDFSNNSIRIRLYWSSIVPITAFILVFTEAFGYKIKMFRYYYCVTFIVYEFIGILTTFAYVHLMMNLCTFPLTSGESFFRTLLLLCPIISSVFLLYSHWIYTSFVHISLCRRIIFGMEQDRTRFRIKLIDYYYLVNFFLFVSLLSHCSMFTWQTLSVPYDFLFAFLFQSAYGLLAMTFTFVMVFGPQCGHTNPMQTIKINYGFLIPFTFFLRLLEFWKGSDDLERVKYSESVDMFMCWFCCLSIGRQWFLNMEMYPRRYENAPRIGVVVRGLRKHG